MGLTFAEWGISHKLYFFDKGELMSNAAAYHKKPQPKAKEKVARLGGKARGLT